MGDTFWRSIDDVARLFPDAVLLTDDHGRSLTAAQLREEALLVAGGLTSFGVSPGDVVSWQLPTTLEAAVMLAAGARLGVVQNPIIPVLRHKEVGHICQQLSTTLLVVPKTW
ncbi:MAG: AMP-binding protein, partial [Actinomycetota bacterium]